MSEAPLAEAVGLAPADLAGLIAGLTRLELTVACAESLTGGLLTAVLTEVPGASAVVRGGLIVYATELKHSLAGVDQELLDRRGPVDPEVAIGLAKGARMACGSAIGVGVTGVAGPDRQNGVAVGTWYVAMVGENSSRLLAQVPDERGTSAAESPSRDQVRGAAVRAAICLLTELITP